MCKHISTRTKLADFSQTIAWEFGVFKKPKLKLNADEKAQSIKKTFALKKSQYLGS